tara:strand:- start:496 stop:984 length:489 start_codon:yes stop_codon:yes gene_type:complete
MRENKIMNAGVGALMLLAGVSLMFIAFFASTPDWKEYDGYVLNANFDEAAGLKARAPIRIAGVQVGEVVSVTLTNYYQARVVMRINSGSLHLASDTSAHIYTEGLLGVRYISLLPGYDDTRLENGDEIHNTSSGFVLESLIGQFLINLGNSGNGTESETHGE